MRPELEAKLMADFPEEFAQKDRSPRDTCMCWGCSHGDGWEPILRRLCEKIKGKGAEFTQVKEKFGTLRVYYTTPANMPDEEKEKVDAAVDEAEAESAVTCEFCGAPDAKSRSGGWIRTLCDECDTESGREAQRKKQLDEITKKKEES